MEQAIEERLRSAAQAIKDDIRGVFRSAAPEYKDYLIAILKEAADEIDGLREQIPAPHPDGMDFRS